MTSIKGPFHKFPFWTFSNQSGVHANDMSFSFRNENFDEEIKLKPSLHLITLSIL